MGKDSGQQAAGSGQKIDETEMGETGIRAQRSDVRDQRRATGIRFSHIELILWERLSPS